MFSHSSFQREFSFLNPTDNSDSILAFVNASVEPCCSEQIALIYIYKRVLVNIKEVILIHREKTEEHQPCTNYTVLSSFISIYKKLQLVIAALAHDVESAIYIVKSILVLKNLKLTLFSTFKS